MKCQNFQLNNNEMGRVSRIQFKVVLTKKKAVNIFTLMRRMDEHPILIKKKQGGFRWVSTCYMWLKKIVDSPEG